MEDLHSRIRDSLKSLFPNTWPFVAVSLAYLSYGVFSVSNWFVQVGIGVLVGLAVVAVYAILMVRFNV